VVQIYKVEFGPTVSANDDGAKMASIRSIKKSLMGVLGSFIPGGDHIYSTTLHE
jgi:hypothetical protein